MEVTNSTLGESMWSDSVKGKSVGYVKRGGEYDSSNKIILKSSLTLMNLNRHRIHPKNFSRRQT